MKVGSLVICIHDTWENYKPGNVVPVKGPIYTIRHIIEDAEGVFIRLEEIVNPVMFYDATFEYTEAMFNIIAFREIQPPISIADIFENELKENCMKRGDVFYFKGLQYIFLSYIEVPTYYGWQSGISYLNMYGDKVIYLGDVSAFTKVRYSWI